MRKILCIFCLSLILTPLFTDEITFTQGDINTFLDFAAEFKEMAGEIVEIAPDASIEEYFYQDSTALLTAAENFLKARGWSYLKLNDFFYMAGTVLEYLTLMETLGMDIEDILGDLMQDIPEDVLRLIEKNQQALRRYFKQRSYDDLMPDWDTLEDAPEIPVIPEALPEFPPLSGVVGIWLLENDNTSIWEFREDGSLSVGTQSPVAVEVLGWEGTYSVSGTKVSIRLDKPHPFPKTFNLLPDRMEGEGEALIRHPEMPFSNR